MPISGTQPYSRYLSSPSLLIEKWGTKGGSRDLPKAYGGHIVREIKIAGTEIQPHPYNSWDVDIETFGPWARIESKLHSKLQDVLGERSELGTTLAEYHSALQMVEGGALRLAKAALALKKGRFRDFLGALNAKPLPKHRHWVRSSPKIASTLWIEYWFGWSPTINDIQAAGRILDSEPPVGSIPFKVATGLKWQMSRKPTYSTPLGYEVDCQSYAKAGGSFTLVNPNLALAQRMGLLNPLTIVVNVTAWSWLLGWFINLNQWVDSLTAFSGYKFMNCYVTRYTVFQGQKRTQDWPTGWNYYNVQGMFTRRYLRLPVVRLHFKSFNLSLTRAATAVSLLTLRLKSL